MNAALVAVACLLVPSPTLAADPTRTILLIAGTKSHGPGEHEYEKGARLLAHCINTAPNLKGFKAEVVTDGWPKDEKVFDSAATVLLFSDGSDRDEKAHPLLREKRLATMAKLMERGVGFVAIHYTVFVPTKKGGDEFLDWCGGYFDYESGEKPRGWYSKIKTCTGKVEVASPKHPVSRGLKPFELREEFYYNMRLATAERGLTPILSAMLPDEKEAQVVAWAVERKNGGRGFGYTGGHFHKNWEDENVRRMVLNALVWTAHGEVPEGGVRSTLPKEDPAPAKPQPATGPSSDTELDYRPADARLKAILIDRSPDESFVSIKADTTGRLFVGGREALFVYEPDDKGGYRPRRELFRFPPDAWVAGIEVRGDDLYVMTASALYCFPGGRTKRDGLKPERLVWGIPLDLHVSFHSLAWGPEGDLYLNHGDPLLGYGDFTRPDHWGHWTIFTKGGEKVPYTGTGGVFRVRPDGSRFRCVAGGLRGPFGLAFDRRWDLFTNDNDHESRPDLYTPARLLHVTPHIDFAWPRGWIASKLPDRRDLVEAMHNVPGRGVPVGMAYYDEPLFPAEYRNTLLEARWDLLTVQRHTIEKRGASYSSKEQPFLVGRVRARPVGVAVGRGGRVFVAVSYMAGNEASPHYPSDLVMVTTADDRPEHPFEPYDATTATAGKLFAELSQPSWERRYAAHVEILRRGGDLLDEAARRLAKVTIGDPAINHLPWLAGAGGSPAAVKALTYDRHLVPDDARFQALRALAEFPALKAPSSVFAEALRDEDPRVRLVALAALFDESRDLPLPAVMGPARSPDTYLLQTATKLLARRAALKDIVDLMESKDASVRLVAVLAAGFRLTVPPPHSAPPKEVALFYPKGNAFFQTAIRYGDRPDERVELDRLGRVGSYTTAELWKAITPSAEQKALFDLLSRGLKDSSEIVRLQAAYFVSLLRDPRTEPEVTKVVAEVRERRLADVPLRDVTKAWAVGPFAADDGGPEAGAVDLTAEYATAMGKAVWREVEGKDGGFALPKAEGPRGTPGHYLFFRLQSAARQTVLLTARADLGVKVWFNGRPLDDGAAEIALDVQPGSNDVLIRGYAVGGSVTLRYRGRAGVTATLPEKAGGATLAQRLREGAGKTEAVPAEFLAIDWPKEAKKGDAEQGRMLFGSLGCTKCHAITADQAGGGAPSLADAGKRFNVAYLVESVLLPSRQVAEQFRTTVITTRQGVTMSGLVVGETADVVELLLTDTTRKQVHKKDVEERKTSNLSPMPAGLVKKPEELRDLLAYLLSEKPLPP
jgi:putative heme-binding domain-containing protein